MPRPLILASASPARLAVLRAAGLHPEVRATGVAEDGVDLTDPAAAVGALARRKAEAGAVDAPADALVVGCDSMLEFHGLLRGKPADADEAFARWQAMRGREGVLWTGHAVVDSATGRVVDEASSAIVRFGNPRDAELEAYVATGEPLRVAGGFTLDGYGAPFVDGIEGDPGTVLGLSLPVLRRLLARLDVEITALWS